MSAHEFLSPQWIAAVASIRDEYRDHPAAAEVSVATVRANVTITEAPFAEPTVIGHIDTTGGAISLDVGHLDEADFALEMRYEVALRIFVDRDPQALLGILVGGEVKLTGDSSKIFGLASVAAPPDPDNPAGGVAREILARIDAVTLGRPG